MILAALWLFILVVLVFFRAVVMPFAGAALVAFLVAPAVDRISQIRVGKRPVPRWGAILIIYVLFFTSLYLLILGVTPRLYAELSRITREAMFSLNDLSPERVRDLAVKTELWLQARGLPINVGSDAPEPGTFAVHFNLEQLFMDTAAKTSGWVKAHAGDIVSLSRRFISGVAAGLFMMFFILMVAAFFSIDVRAIRSYVRTLVPPEFADDGRLLAARIDRSLAGVVRGQITICLVNGALTLAGLLLFGVNFAFLLATIATFLSLIPIFGAILSSVPIVAIALAQGWQTAVAMLLWIIGIHALEAYFLNPKIMGTAAKVHPIVVAFSLIAGERTFGLLGALFAVPLAAILVACFEYARLKAQPEEGPVKPLAL
jgi:predicted PurR-regulated permease PerM